MCIKKTADSLRCQTAVSNMRIQMQRFSLSFMCHQGVQMTPAVHRKSQSWISRTGCTRGEVVFLIPSYLGVNERGVHKLPGPPDRHLPLHFFFYQFLRDEARWPLPKICGADGWPQGTGKLRSQLTSSSAGGEGHKGASYLALDPTKVWGRAHGPEILPCYHPPSHLPPATEKQCLLAMGPRTSLLSCSHSHFPMPWIHTP